MITRYVLGRASPHPAHIALPGSDKTLCGIPLKTLQATDEDNPEMFPPCRMCARIERIAEDWGVKPKEGISA